MWKVCDHAYNTSVRISFKNARQTRTHEFKLHCGFQRGNSVFDKCYFRVLQMGTQRQVVCVWFSRFILDIFHKYEWFFFYFACEKERLCFKWCNSLSIFSKRWFFNNRPMTSNKLFRFNGFGFNLIFKKGAWKWFQEMKRKKKNKWKHFYFKLLRIRSSWNWSFKSIVSCNFFSLYRFWAFQCWPNVQFSHRICLTIQILLQKCSGNCEWEKEWNGKSCDSPRILWALFGELKHVCLNIQLEMYEDNSILNGNGISAVSSDFIHENALICNEYKARLICAHVHVHNKMNTYTQIFMNSDNLVTITTVCIFLVVGLVSGCFCSEWCRLKSVSTLYECRHWYAGCSNVSNHIWLKHFTRRILQFQVI